MKFFSLFLTYCEVILQRSNIEHTNSHIFISEINLTLITCSLFKSSDSHIFIFNAMSDCCSPDVFD